METFDEVNHSQTFDHLYGFRRSDFFPLNLQVFIKSWCVPKKFDFTLSKKMDETAKLTLSDSGRLDYVRSGRLRLGLARLGQVGLG